MSNKENYGMWLGFIAVLVAIFMMGWAIRGEIAANTAAIAKMEGALLTHISAYSHTQKVAEGTDVDEGAKDE